MDEHKEFAKLLPGVAKDIEAGKYATAAEAIEAVKQIVDPPAPPNRKAGL